MIGFFILQLFVWVSQPINNTSLELLSNSLITRTTPIILEEIIQEELDLIITKDSTLADIWIRPIFVYYERPNTESSIFLLKNLKEEVGLEMKLIFEHRYYFFYQSLECKETLIKEAKSNFLSIEDSENDFADMLIFNLIKKTLNNCLNSADKLLF